MGVFGCNGKRVGMFVVDFVDVFVQWTPMKESVNPVKIEIFDKEKDYYLQSDS
jgi:hypothetical protein